MSPRNATVHELDRLTARVFDHRRTGARLDAYRIDDTYFIDIDLPGADPAGIDVSNDHHVFTIRAERKHPDTERPRLALAKCPTDPVTRQVSLSDTLDTDRLDARYEGGVLTLSIPVSKPGQPRDYDQAA